MLRLLELFGFKSFADKTVFEFSSGITGVVGPNGSGKSNVVDSIKWILGDQSAKSLRGKEMTDVIFNGSASRGGAQFAEATLVFDNRSRFLPLDLDEVSVGRRLWQSGDSEYLINRGTARLKDVRELFMGTGAGAASYCIIEQGRVDQILQSNAANRRSIFEEAAGISRIKARRSEALRRLDRVEQNLVRLADIVDEVESQVTSIRSQAQRATRFREVSQELQLLWIGVAADDFRRESGRVDAIRTEMEQAAANLLDSTQRQRQTKQQLDEADASLNQLDDRLREAERLASERNSRAASLHTTREHYCARDGELQADLARLQRQCRLMDVRVAEAENELEDLSQTAEHESQAIDRKRQQLQQSDAQLVAVQQACREAAREIEESREKMLSQVEANSEFSSALSASETQLFQERERHNSVTQTLLAADARVKERAVQRAEDLSCLRDASNDLKAAQDVADRLLQNRQQLLTEHTDSQQSLSHLREQRSALLARRTILEDLEDRQEGFGIGVREILRRADEAVGEPWNQIVGTVADLLDVDLDNAALLEVALSGRSQLLVVRSLEPLLTYLRSGRSMISGRVGFVSIESSQAAQAPDGHAAIHDDPQLRGDSSPILSDALPSDVSGAGWWDTDAIRDADAAEASSLTFGQQLSFPGDLHVGWVDQRSSSPVVRSVFHQHMHGASLLFGQPGVVGRADGLARSPRRLSGLASALLADTWVVESLSDALRLHRQTEGVWRFVTLQGELLENNATLFAGTIRPETAVMSRKSELRRLRNELARIEHEIAQRELSLTTMSETLQSTDAELKAARELVSDRTHTLRECELRCGETDRSFRTAQQFHQEQQNLLTTTDQKLQTILVQMESHAADKQQGTTLLSQLQDQIRDRELLSAKRQSELESFDKSRMASSVELSRSEERLLSVRESLGRLTEDLEQRKLQQAEALRRSQNACEQHRALVLRQLNVSAEIHELAVLSDNCGAQIQELSEDRIRLRTRRSEAMQAESQMQEHCRSQESRHHKLDVQLRGIEHQLQSSAARIREEFQLEVEEAVAAGHSAVAIWLDRDRSQPEPAGDAETPDSVETSEDALQHQGPASFDARAAAVLQDDEQFEPLRQQIEQHLDRLRKRLRNMGNVSTESIESLTELETRFNRLKSQLTDLEAARDALRDIVRRINQESRRLFVESFESVRGHFRDVFRRLFGGGEADLILEDPEEVLECAIDVVARPPGKELRSISLLSGGEKTLTAVALLLSIFKSRPSPFCILDEVDAALDDANIGRFVNVLRDFQQSTQFILITHRKPTMAVTDMLYGVTMEESGISRRLSLRFDDVDESGNFVPRPGNSSRAA
jgi:chromosome segregation protein